MKNTIYSDKLREILNASQFEARNGKSDDLTTKTEKLINNSLHQLMKQGTISEKIDHRLKMTGLQPPRFFGFAKYKKKRYAVLACSVNTR